MYSQFCITIIYKNQLYITIRKYKLIISSLLLVNHLKFVSVMREWSLFALRNILEGNLDNQNFVANIDSVGSIDTESSVTLTDTLKMASIKNSISDSDTMFI